MLKKVKFVLLLMSLLITPSIVHSQTDDFGGIGSVSVSKNIGTFTSLSLEQELRMDRQLSSVSRSSTSVSADFTIARRLLKAELDYILMYRRNSNERYEYRHRFTAGFVGQYRIDRIALKLRTRGQATLRDEMRGDYGFNPKYVWRNRLAIEYNIRKSPFTPYISGEIFTPINGKQGFFMDSYRLIGGTEYKLSKKSSLDFQIRFDKDVQIAEPKSIIWGGIGWNYSFD